MRKILTKDEKERKETRNKIVIGLILVVVMIISTAGFAFFSGSPDIDTKTKIEYNGIKFVLNENDLWQFEIQGFWFATQYNPKDTENISVPIFAMINSYSGKPLFFSGEESQAKVEIARNLQNFVLRMQDICLENYENNEKNCSENLPIKNCSQDNVIVIKEAEDIKISQDKECVLIDAPYTEQTRAADAFIFKILGIKSF